MVDLAEQYLLDLGFCQVRVRIHGEDAPIARIELAPSEFPKLLSGDIAAGIDRRFAQIGFAFVTLDLGGYRTGSMNKTLPL